MSKTLSKQELLQQAWLAKLRNEGDRKCHGALFVTVDWRNGTRERLACAFGLLAEILVPEKVAAAETQARRIQAHERGTHRPFSIKYSEVAMGAHLGLSELQTRWLVHCNDGAGAQTMHTFAQIAELAEKCFAQNKARDKILAAAIAAACPAA